jgi:hypothetical protein
MPANPSNETLQAAATVAPGSASWPISAVQVSRRARAAAGRQRGVGYGRPRRARGLNLPPINGPTVAEMVINDPLATLLVVAGRNGAEVVAAANTLLWAAAC